MFEGNGPNPSFVPRESSTSSPEIFEDNIRDSKTHNTNKLYSNDRRNYNFDRRQCWKCRGYGHVRKFCHSPRRAKAMSPLKSRKQKSRMSYNEDWQCNDLSGFENVTNDIFQLNNENFANIPIDLESDSDEKDVSDCERLSSRKSLNVHHINDKSASTNEWDNYNSDLSLPVAGPLLTLVTDDAYADEGADYVFKNLDWSFNSDSNGYESDSWARASDVDRAIDQYYGLKASSKQPPWQDVADIPPVIIPLLNMPNVNFFEPPVAQDCSYSDQILSEGYFTDSSLSSGDENSMDVASDSEPPTFRSEMKFIFCK